MERQDEKINRVLVHLFNDVLQLEEDSLRAAGVTGLSMREIHILEAVCAAGEANTMTALARQLRVTVGSLTVAMNTLERKGYVTRQRSTSDKRRIHVLPTDRAWQVEDKHRDYHRQMTRAVMAAVPPEQLSAVVEGLEAAWRYFNGQMKEEGQ